MITQPDSKATAAVRQWLRSVVIDLNLCPFAGRELAAERVRFVETSTTSPDAVLASLREELQLLVSRPWIETTLLICPQAFPDFLDYNEFLDEADRLLRVLNLVGVLQIASFHPRYQFAETGEEDAENYTNRAPYPLFHLLREASVERAIAGHPNVEQIPERNIRVMEDLGVQKLRALLHACLDQN